MDSTHNEPYWDQQVSGGFYYNTTAAATPWAPAFTKRTWANVSTGIVHMYHSARWGGWQFALHSRNDTDQTLTFACTLLSSNGTVLQRGAACPASGPAVVQGGWQEGRGGDIGPQYTRSTLNNSYFVENIFEELDHPSEWFLDKARHRLYLIPPNSSVTPGDMQLVTAESPRVVMLGDGNSSAPVMHVSLENVTIAHAAASFMLPYEEPSGGDWSIHRGASVFADGAVDITIRGCHFDQVDGNGVFLSRYVRNSSIVDNDFSAVGDSAILLVGASGHHRTNQAGSVEYPAYNLIEGNHINTVGVWGKQTAGYFKSVARANIVRNNVFHDGPRSGVNFNDGFAGGALLEGNLLFNFVRESNDHGGLLIGDPLSWITAVASAYLDN